MEIPLRALGSKFIRDNICRENTLPIQTTAFKIQMVVISFGKVTIRTTRNGRLQFKFFTKFGECLAVVH